MTRSKTEELANLDAQIAEDLPGALACLRETQASLSELLGKHSLIVELANEDNQPDVAERHQARLQELSELSAEMDRAIEVFTRAGLLRSP